MPTQAQLASARRSAAKARQEKKDSEKKLRSQLRDARAATKAAGKTQQKRAKPRNPSGAKTFAGGIKDGFNRFTKILPALGLVSLFMPLGVFVVNVIGIKRFLGTGSTTARISERLLATLTAYAICRTVPFLRRWSNDVAFLGFLLAGNEFLSPILQRLGQQLADFASGITDNISGVSGGPKPVIPGAGAGTVPVSNPGMDFISQPPVLVAGGTATSGPGSFEQLGTAIGGTIGGGEQLGGALGGIIDDLGLLGFDDADMADMAADNAARQAAMPLAMALVS